MNSHHEVTLSLLCVYVVLMRYCFLIHWYIYCSFISVLFPDILFSRLQKTEQQVQGVLNLIDLAGSERLSRSGATGDRLKETQVSV